jgi:hypothetical protein
MEQEVQCDDRRNASDVAYSIALCLPVDTLARSKFWTTEVVHRRILARVAVVQGGLLDHACSSHSSSFA